MKPSLRLPFRLTFLLALGIFFPFLIPEWFDPDFRRTSSVGLMDVGYKEAAGLHRNKQDARLSWIIQQHLNRLIPEQKNFLIDLSVYRLPFDREAANYIMAGRRQPPNFWTKLVLFRQWFKPKKTDKQLDIVKALQELCNCSLLTKTEDNRYLFPALVQEYLYQEQKQDLTTGHQQAIEYYQLHRKEEQSWQVREDVSEYLEIIYHLCELEQYAQANYVLNICFEFLNLRGYYLVLVELYEKLADRWQSNLKPEERYDYAWVWNRLGIFESYLGQVKQAIDCHNQSLAIFQEIDDFDGIAKSFMNLGNAYDSLGDYRKAIDYHQQSLEIEQQIGDRSGEGNTWFNLGNSWKNLQRKSEAKEAYENSRKLSQAMGLDKEVEECDEAIQDLENKDIKSD